ncbi:MAG: FAD-dependent monooxygenase, partial [Stellaceae bacterium]
MRDDVELLIAGGGLNGLLLGIACAGAGLPVAVVDRQDPAALLEAGFDGRSSAIAYGSQQALAALGLWPFVAAEAEPILEIRVADDNASFFLHYDHRELGPDLAQGAAPLGWIIENRVLRHALIERARSLPALTLLAPLAVEAVATTAGAVEAMLSDGRRVQSRLVAAADGAPSPLRRAAGIRTLEWRYPQTAIVTTVRHERPHLGIAVEHFLPAGPFAILPMT